MRLLFVGGGSGGPVSPLLAVADNIRDNHPQAEIFFVGGKQGPEKLMAQQAGFTFFAITSGKLRRYMSFKNIIAPIFIIFGFFESVFLLKKLKPDCVFGTGSFIQVPLMWAAFFFRIPVIIHQQDMYPSLSNQLCSLIAKRITVTFEDSLRDFAQSFGLFYKKNPDKVVWTGNPFRKNLMNVSREEALKKFNLKKDFPTVLIFGGGTGAEGINRLVVTSLPLLTKAVQIIHVTGAGKAQVGSRDNYHPYEFIGDMGSAFAAADLVVCRAGLSTITELSWLQKVSIIIPMPKSHQEFNAWALGQRGAAIVAKQNQLDGEKFVALIRRVLVDGTLQENVRRAISKIMPKTATEKISTILIQAAVSHERN